MPALLFLSPYKSRKRLWEEWQDKHQGKKEFISGPMQRGIDSEDNGIAFAFFNYPFPGFSFRRVGTVLGPNNLTSCSPDAVLLRHDDQRISGLEIKTPLPHNIPKSVEELPPHHVIQVAMCIHVLAAHDWHLFYYYPEKEEKSKMFLVRPRLNFSELEQFFQYKANELSRMDEKEGTRRATRGEKENNWKFIKERLELIAIVTPF